MKELFLDLRVEIAFKSSRLKISILVIEKTKIKEKLKKIIGRS